MLLKLWRRLNIPGFKVVNQIYERGYKQGLTITEQEQKRYLMLREAARPIVDWYIMLEAGRELDGDEPLTDDMVVLRYMGNGASTMVRVGQIRALVRALYGERKN